MLKILLPSQAVCKEHFSCFLTFFPWKDDTTIGVIIIQLLNFSIIFLTINI